MELSFVYSGNETVGAMVVSRLEAAGCTRTDDVAHAEAIITYCTSQTALEDAYFVGGDEEAVAEARPVLEAIAGTVQETGGAGSAQLARAAYTLQTTAQVISAVEADALYRAVRRSSASLDQATERVGAATPVAEQVLAAVNTGRFDGMYTVEMWPSCPPR